MAINLRIMWPGSGFAGVEGFPYITYRSCMFFFFLKRKACFIDDLCCTWRDEKVSEYGKVLRCPIIARVRPSEILAGS